MGVGEWWWGWGSGGGGGGVVECEDERSVKKGMSRGLEKCFSVLIKKSTKKKQ